MLRSSGHYAEVEAASAALDDLEDPNRYPMRSLMSLMN
jgi:hypothetical protein